MRGVGIYVATGAAIRDGGASERGAKRLNTSERGGDTGFMVGDLLTGFTGDTAGETLGDTAGDTLGDSAGGLTGDLTGDLIGDTGLCRSCLVSSKTSVRSIGLVMVSTFFFWGSAVLLLEVLWSYGRGGQSLGIGMYSLAVRQLALSILTP